MKEVLQAVRNFLAQNGQRPEATQDIEERMLQCLSELGRMTYSVQWGDPKEKVQERVAQLLVLLIGTCVQQDWDTEKLIKDRLNKLPTLPAPKAGREKARGLRL